MFQVQQLLKSSAMKHPEALRVLAGVKQSSRVAPSLMYLPQGLEADSDSRKLGCGCPGTKNKRRARQSQCKCSTSSHIAVGACSTLPLSGLSLTMAVLPCQRHHGSITHRAVEPHSGRPLPPRSFPALGRQGCHWSHLLQIGTNWCQTDTA